VFCSSIPAAPAASRAFFSAASLFFLIISANPPPFAAGAAAGAGDGLLAAAGDAAPTTAPAPATSDLSLICEGSTFFNFGPEAISPSKLALPGGVEAEELAGAGAIVLVFYDCYKIHSFINHI